MVALGCLSCLVAYKHHGVDKRPSGADNCMVAHLYHINDLLELPPHCCICIPGRACVERFETCSPPPPPQRASGQRLVWGVVGVQNRGVAPPPPPCLGVVLWGAVQRGESSVNVPKRLNPGSPETQVWLHCPSLSQCAVYFWAGPRAPARHVGIHSVLCLSEGNAGPGNPAKPCAPCATAPPPPPMVHF